MRSKSKSTEASSWCCRVFADHYEQAGERGLAVLVLESTHQGARFVLQSRAAAVRDEEEVRTQVPVSLVTESDIFYCPWCGRKLSSWYAKDWKRLIRAGVFSISIRAGE